MERIRGGPDTHEHHLHVRSAHYSSPFSRQRHQAEFETLLNPHSFCILSASSLLSPVFPFLPPPSLLSFATGRNGSNIESSSALSDEEFALRIALCRSQMDVQGGSSMMTSYVAYVDSCSSPPSPASRSAQLRHAPPRRQWVLVPKRQPESKSTTIAVQKG